ncbi:MAG TPA: hypothetical protein VN441_17410 [Syntrophomonas sp.]|nr:hypothetical protein [Syntrophomonas sp.]
MKTAQKIKINYHTKAAYEMADSLPCPRSTNDVYTLGVSLQYCIRSKYLEISELLQSRNYFTEQAANQLPVKSKIENLAAYKLNVQLNNFYNQGGPVIDEPVTPEMARKIQPFYNRIMSRFLQSLDEIASRVLTRQISAEQMITEVNEQVIDVYSSLGRLYQVKEIENAFADLVEIIQS